MLWVKFGRYMCQSLFEGEQEEQSSGKGDGNFVRFYQRVGGVGIWGFLDGGLQVRCLVVLVAAVVLTCVAGALPRSHQAGPLG